MLTDGIVVKNLLAALCIAALLPTSVASANTRVVTTTTDLAEIAKAIGGKHVKVKSICAGNQDPHYLQAKPSYMVTLSRADLLVYVGLDLEIGWLPLLISGARNPNIQPGKSGNLDASTAIKPIGVRTGAVDRSMGDVHPRGNPHYWLDPDNTIRVARLISRRLSALDTKHAGDFNKNLEAFVKKRRAAIERWDKRMSPYAGQKVASYHQTFDYFIKRFGLVPAGYIEERPGIPPGPSYLSKLTKRLKADRVPVIFHETFFERRASDLVARKSGAKVMVAPTSAGAVKGADDYESMMDTLITRFIGVVGAR